MTATTTPPAETDADRRARLGLAAFLGGAGVGHFVIPDFFDAVVPSWLPGDPRAWTYASGVVEIAVGGLVANRSTARVGSWAALAVFVGVYPANIWDSLTHPPTDARGIGSWIRLPLQVPMFWWAARTARRAP